MCVCVCVYICVYICVCVCVCVCVSVRVCVRTVGSARDALPDAAVAGREPVGGGGPKRAVGRVVKPAHSHNRNDELERFRCIKSNEHGY